MRNCVFSGRPGPNVTVSMPSPASFGSFAANALPASSTRRIFCASALAIGAVNESVIGRMGMHCASLFTRSHVNDARNAGRTLNASACVVVVATPVVAAMPLPHTSFTSAPCGSVRAQASVTSGESGASRRRRNLSRSLPVVGRRNRNPRERPVSPSISSMRRYDRSERLAIVEDRLALLTRHEAHADLLVDAGRHAARVGHDRLGLRRRVEPEHEDLVLVDAAAFVRQAAQDRGAAGGKVEALPARDRRAVDVGQARP